MPATLSSSITTVDLVFANREVTWCNVLVRWWATVRWSAPRRCAALRRLRLPLGLRVTARCSRLSFLRHERRWRGLGSLAPSERVASVLTPRSTPTTGPRCTGATRSCCTTTETYQCPACSETVAESILVLLGK